MFREDDYSVWAGLLINDNIRQELAIKRRFLKEISLKSERNRVKKRRFKDGSERFDYGL